MSMTTDSCFHTARLDTRHASMRLDTLPCSTRHASRLDTLTVSHALCIDIRIWANNKLILILNSVSNRIIQFPHDANSLHSSHCFESSQTRTSSRCIFRSSRHSHFDSSHSKCLDSTASTSETRHSRCSNRIVESHIFEFGQKKSLTLKLSKCERFELCSYFEMCHPYDSRTASPFEMASGVMRFDSFVLNSTPSRTAFNTPHFASTIANSRSSIVKFPETHPKIIEDKTSRACPLLHKRSSIWRRSALVQHISAFT